MKIVLVLSIMYRNLHYFIDDFESPPIGKIRLTTWDANGNPVTEIHKHRVKIAHTVDYETGEKSIFGENIVVKYFDTVMERKGWLKRNSANTKIIECLRPEVEFLRTHFLDKNDSPTFMQYPLRTHYIDIEIAVGNSRFPLEHTVKLRKKGESVESTVTMKDLLQSSDAGNIEVWDDMQQRWSQLSKSCYAPDNSFPYPAQAAMPINLITIYDSHLQRFFTWAMPIYTNSIKPVENADVFIFDDEKQLLKHYLAWHKENMPDLITGWNSYGFDMPYIIKRLENLFGLDIATSYSPVQKVRVNTPDEKEPNRIEVQIGGISHLDYLILVRDKFKSNYQTYKLGDVCQEELGIGKLSYAGHFKDFWRKDFQRFYEYNVHDVRLLVQLDAKLKFIDICRKICNLGLTEYEAIYYSIPYILGAVSIYSKKNFNTWFPTYRQEEVDKDSLKSDDGFTGAWVKPPRANLYTEGILGIDLNSLYPNTMIALNLSPETKFGKELSSDPVSTTTILLKTGKKYSIDTKEYTKLLQNKFIKSANGILFMNPETKRGVVAEFLEKMYNERKRVRGEMRKLEKELAELEKKD